MNDLRATTIKSHGGLDRWNQLNTVSARLILGGALWALKGQEGVLDGVVVTASLHDERVSHRPFGAPDRRSAFTPGRVAIESDDGTILESLDQPRTSFVEHTAETPWNRLQLAYFAGAAMWTYLTQPFSFTLPGFRMTELDPWEEAGQLWRRLLVAWPSHLATHSTEQTLYFSPDGLLVRHDYDVEISGGATCSALPLRLPRRRRHHGRHQTPDLAPHPRRRVTGRTPHRLDRSQRDHIHLTARENQMSTTRPPFPPFDLQTALQKVQAAEDAWNTCDPITVALAYTEDSEWRNRDQFITGRAEIVEFLYKKWERELDYALRKELWSFRENRIAVRFQYESQDRNGQCWRSYGNELWEFTDDGLMRRREASINDVPIAQSDRRIHGPRPEGERGRQLPVH